MLFKKFVAEGLAHNSYIVGSGGELAVIDPWLDCEEYLAQTLMRWPSPTSSRPTGTRII
jgi:hypothetical protein